MSLTTMVECEQDWGAAVSGTSHSEVHNLLAVIAAEVRVLRDVERRVDSISAPRFTAFDFVRTDEMGLSKCIAALLDPLGTHGQSSRYLKLFLTAIGCPPEWNDGLQHAAVDVETRANGYRRFDIEVQLPGPRAIAIENKPWASDQQLQLTDYANHLDKTCQAGGWRLVYLSQGEPSVGSISRADRLIHEESGSLVMMSFNQLAQWLEQCAQCTKPLAVRLFIEQLEQFVRQTLCGEASVSETKSISDVVMASQDSLRAALLVGGTIGAVKRSLLLDGLKTPLATAFGGSLVWEEAELLGGKARAGFGFRPQPGAPAYIRFQFEGARWSSFFWGLYRTPARPRGAPERAEDRALCAALEKEFRAGVSGEAWLWYSDNPRHAGLVGGQPLPTNWEYDEVPWLAMQRQDLHLGIVQLVQRVSEVLATSPAWHDPVAQSMQLNGAAVPQEASLEIGK